MDVATFVIPTAIPLNRVALKKKPLETQYGIQYHVDATAREVTLRGDQESLDKVMEQLVRAFPHIGVHAAAKVVPGKSNRSFAVRNAPSIGLWRFVKTRRTVSDVSTYQYPFELAQAGKAFPPESANNEDAESKAALIRKSSYRERFLVPFDAVYMASEVKALNIIAERQHALKLKAVFGTKLYHLDSNFETNGVHSRSLLLKNSRCIRSAWTNVCDVDGPELKALLADLRKTVIDLGIPVSKERLAVRVKGSNKEDIKMKYLRENGVWVHQSTNLSVGSRCVHDISLRDRLSFRVRVYNQAQRVPINSACELYALHIQEPEKGDDIFGTKVLLVESAVMSGAKIEWISIKSEVIVPFRGLNFKIVHMKDNELQLEVRVPRALDQDLEPSLGEKFGILVPELVAILDKYIE
uniref:Uncharacterized protein n=1 Tax=Globisporangium ultimum (strain ATCC 200006 / CBS 805.95 / DAOM BR144) TaxID=431595 RepID=K3XBQ8_GLOUD